MNVEIGFWQAWGPVDVSYSYFLHSGKITLKSSLEL
jgi:hypothetical protein